MVEMQRPDGDQRLLAGSVKFILPKGNVLLEFFDFLCFCHKVFFRIVGGAKSLL